MTDEITIVRAGEGDIPEVLEIYASLFPEIEAGENFPGWSRGVYPCEETARAGLREGALYILRLSGRAAGAVIINTNQPPEYGQADWAFPVPENGALVMHTLAVSPAFRGRGVARRIVEFCERQARLRGLEAVRFDTREGNLPAQRLYESCGYRVAGVCHLMSHFSERKRYLCFEKKL